MAHLPKQPETLFDAGTTDDSPAAKAARQLLANRNKHKRNEANVQSDVDNLLRAMEVGHIEREYQTATGPADFYLPNRRAFIECKAYPHAADPEKEQDRDPPESPLEQLNRYVLPEIEDTLRSPMLPGFEAVRSSEDWTGIVTDGSNWHVYRYSHAPNAVAQLEKRVQLHTESDVLVALLEQALSIEVPGKTWIPQEPGVLFTDLKEALDDLYRQLPRKAVGPTQTKRNLWLDMMTTSGMVPSDDAGQERLFLSHSFLIVVVRLVSHTLAAPNQPDWTSALQDGFASWVLDFERGRRWVGDVWQLVDGYDWRKRRGDVLRDLYHQYVSEQDRKVFGEFYTPDWLAALMVEEVLDDNWIAEAVAAAQEDDVEGIGVLDPACGSGTFLYHAALRILDSGAVRDLRPVQQANVVTQLVNGMDIHPVAVEIAKVNLERALSAEPTEGASAFKVFLGDSLQTASRGALLFGHREDAMLLTSPKGREVFLPLWFVQHTSFADNMRRMVNAAARGESLPSGIATGGERKELEECHRQLTEIIDSEGNSVWTWYAINLVGPYLLALRKIDRIVANPPWVKLADIQVEERKRVMEEFGKSLGLQGGGKQAPHLDIASFFILRTRELYTAHPDGNPGVWLVKKSALRSGQWAPFRRIHKPTLAQTVDLEDLQPFGGGDATRCCLLMEHRPMRHHAPSPRLVAQRRVKRRLSMHDTLHMADSLIQFDEAPAFLPQAASEYAVSDFRQGATLVPHVLVLVASQENTRRLGWTRVETRASRHMPWREVDAQTGEVPKEWIRPVHTSPDMLPYMAMREPPRAIVPTDDDGKLHSQPDHTCPFWSELDEIYDAKRGHGRGTPPTLMMQIDFARKLSKQPLRPQRSRRMVLYPSSGDIMRAARTQAGVAVVDSTLFWQVVRSEAEAGYLVALLNARCLRRAFAESKESGRHFQLHPWRKVPIPRYDRTNAIHRRLGTLCSRAETIVERRVKEELGRDPGLQQQKLSDIARHAVLASNAGREIEDLAQQLLPEQAD